MGRKNVAVVMGGYSGEYEVSIKSGQTIYENLDKSIYNVYRIIITKDNWCFLDDRGQKTLLEKGNFHVQLSSGYIIKFDVCFNTIHGIPGENGQIQAFWDILGIRYTGCSSYLSALTFNKKDLLSIATQYGIPTAGRITLQKGKGYDTKGIIEKLGLPLFVKPNQSGSSLGASKVTDAEQLPSAVEEAFREDEVVLVEEYIVGTEVSVGVVDIMGTPKVLGITEIVSQNEFFDFDAKYKGESEEITPARLDENTAKKVEELTIKLYTMLGMTGFSRSEFIIRDGQPYFLEMNTNPGFSTSSILPQQAAHAGISLVDLCGWEVEKALAKNI